MWYNFKKKGVFMIYLKKLSLGVIALSATLFVGCSSQSPKVLAYSDYQTVYKTNCEAVISPKQKMLNDVLSNSRYGKIQNGLDFGIKGHFATDGSNNLILHYINNGAGLNGVTQNIVEVIVPFKYYSDQYKSTISFSKSFTINVIKDEMDKLDRLSNIESDVKEITSSRFVSQSFGTIDFDPKRVKFGIASSVSNGLLHSKVEPVDGYVSKVCTMDEGCDQDTHYQSIDVTLENGDRVNIIQSITDGRYSFIHNNDKVLLFQLEDNTWVVKSQN